MYNQSASRTVLSTRLLNFLSTVWSRALAISNGDDQKAQIVNDNILKLYGFPIGVIYPDAVQQAIRLNSEPKSSDESKDKGRSRIEVFNDLLLKELGCTSESSSTDIENSRKIKATVSRLIALSRTHDLDAIAGPVGSPRNNAGVYRGRIAELDPTRREYNLHPARPQENHNMTNITFPSLNDEDGQGGPGSEEEQDLQNTLNEADDLESTPDGMEVSYTDPKTPERVFVPIHYDIGAPERIRFSLDDDGAISLEPSLSAVSEWWKSRTPAQKRYYLERHPNSKYAKAYRAAVAKKKAQAKKGGKTGKNSPKIVKDLNDDAAVNEQAINESGIDLEDVIDDELSHEQDLQVDELNKSIDEELDSDNEDDLDTDEEETPKSKPRLDPESAEKLGEVSQKFGFFKTIGNIAKKRLSNSTMGSMARFMKGTMKDGDKEKVVKGLATAASVLAVVAIGAGVTMLAGPGVLATYLNEFVGSGDSFDFGSSEGDFDFSVESSDKPSGDDELSDEDLEKLMKHFTAWMIHKAKTEQQEQQA